MSSAKTEFNVAFIKLATKAEGPFTRCCIWFQGCNLHCPGCCNQSLQPLVPNHIMSEDELLGIVLDAKKRFGIEGITLTGGEPSLQKGLVSFNQKVHAYGLGIILFSGRYKEELPGELVNSVDLLLDGPYVESKHDDDRFLIGSKNKRITFVTERYKAYEGYFSEGGNPNEIEVSEEEMFFNGD